MSDPKLEAVKDVDIEEGIFKYVLIKVYGKEQSDGVEPSKLIVRGYGDCQWHCKTINPHLKCEINFKHIQPIFTNVPVLLVKVQVWTPNVWVAAELNTIHLLNLLKFMDIHRFDEQDNIFIKRKNCLFVQGYGKADHAESRKILLKKYTDYNVEISDEGY